MYYSIHVYLLTELTHVALTMQAQYKTTQTQHSTKASHLFAK